jgi:hypothetical protein
MTKATADHFETIKHPCFSVEMAENWLIVSVWGHWTIQDAADLQDALNSGLDYLEAHDKPRLILYDAHRLNIFKFANPATVQRLMETSRNISSEYIAFFNATPLYKSFAHLLSRINPGITKTFRFFTERKDAEKFLRAQAKVPVGVS